MIFRCCAWARRCAAEAARRGISWATAAWAWRETRREFEEWIGEDLAALERSIDGLLASSGVSPRDVDAVFLTGGTSFVPAVRRIFDVRFGADRVRSGNEFTSVARGLALGGKPGTAGI